MMAKRFKKNLDYLSVLCKCKSKQRCTLLKTADKQLIQTICDCAENVLSGNVPLDSKSKKKLFKHKRLLRQLRGKKSWLAKRSKLVQSGGFLPALLSPLLGIVGGLVTDLILKR